MNVVACNACGRPIGEKVISSMIKMPAVPLASHKTTGGVWSIKFDDLIAKGFDPSRGHFCKPCLARALIAKLHKMIPEMENEMTA